MVAVVTGVTFFAGDLYVKGFYAAQGIPDSEVDLSVPRTMTYSFLAFLYPAFYFMALFSVMWSVQRKTGIAWSEIPILGMMLVVAITWLMKLLFDYTTPLQEPVFGTYHVRDFVLVGLALLALAAVFITSTRPGVTSKFSPISWAYAWMVVISLLTLLGTWILNGTWALNSWQTALMAAVPAFAIYSIYSDVKKPDSAKTGNTVVNPGTCLYGGCAITILVLAAAGLAGSNDGREISAGCELTRIAEFDPTPPGILENQTYWMVMHENGQYYLRQIHNGTHVDKVMIVPELEAGTVTLLPLPATRQC